MAGDPIEILVIVETLEIIETEITVVEIIEKEIITITTETEIMIETEIEITTETEIMTETEIETEITVEGDIPDVEDTVLRITQNFASLSQIYHKDVHGKI